MTAGYQGQLIEEIEETTEPKTQKFYIFQENEAKIIMNYKGKTVKEFGTFNDFYGELACLKSAIKEALEYAKYYNITETSEATIEVELYTYLIKMCKTSRKRPFKGNDEYESIGHRDGYPKTIVKKIIWSTSRKLPIEQTARAVCKCGSGLVEIPVENGIDILCPKCDILEVEQKGT